MTTQDYDKYVCDLKERLIGRLEDNAILFVNRNTMEVSIDGTVELTCIDQFPCKFSYISGNMLLSGSSMTTLENGPPEIGGSLDLIGCKKLNTFEHFPRYIGGSLLMHGTAITSLHNIHKHIRYIKEHLVIGVEVTSDLLGVFLIQGLQSVRFNVIRAPFGNSGQRYSTMVDIINNRLAGDRDLIACQDELIDAGFSDCARF